MGTVEAVQYPRLSRVLGKSQECPSGFFLAQFNARSFVYMKIAVFSSYDNVGIWLSTVKKKRIF